MSDLICLSDRQMRRIASCFPLSHGVTRVDGRQFISGIIFVIKNGLRWRDAPADMGRRFGDARTAVVSAPQQAGPTGDYASSYTPDGM